MTNVAPSLIELDVCDPAVPVHSLPSPVTVHDTAFVVLQITSVEAPEDTSDGRARIVPVMPGDRHDAEPGEQNWGATQVPIVVVEQSAFVRVIV